MSLVLYYHPLSSFCQKVLIALYENGTAFEGRVVNLGDRAASAEFFRRWPLGKIPLLRDEAQNRTVPETSVMVEYLDRIYPSAEPLLPRDEDAALEVRLWDRFFDLYVNVPMQKIVTDRLRPEGQGDATGVAEARRLLDSAYGIADHHLKERRFAAGDAFSLADCAAAPALFYAGIVQPFEANHPHLSAYFERLLARPSAKRVLAEARPFFRYFPYREAMPPRFLEEPAEA
jgi:glutathione S-transferase